MTSGGAMLTQRPPSERKAYYDGQRDALARVLVKTQLGATAHEAVTDVLQVLMLAEEIDEAMAGFAEVPPGDFAESLAAAVKASGDRPPHEVFRDAVHSGLIDGEGRLTKTYGGDAEPERDLKGPPA